MSFIQKINASASFWNTIYNGLRISGNLLTLPIALKMLPANEMGLYYTFTALGGVAAFLDMGMGTTVARQAAYIYSGGKSIVHNGVPESSEDGTPNMDLFSEMVVTVQRIFTILGWGAVLLLMIPGGVFIGKNIISSGMNLSLIGAWVIYAAAASHALGTGFWGSFLMGVKQERLSAVIGVYTQAGYVVMVLIGLLAGCGIWAYSIALLLSGISQRNACRNFFIKLTRVSFKVKPDYKIINVLWPMSWRLWIVYGSMYAFQKTSILFSSKYAGLDDTAGYGFALALFGIIYQIASTPLFVSYPNITRLRVAGKVGEIKKIFLQRLYGSILISALCIIVVMLTGQYFLNLIGSQTKLPSETILILSAAFFLLDKHQNEYFILVLTENKNPFIIPYACTAMIAIMLMYFGANMFGLMGLILCQGISQSIINNWWVVVRGWQGLRT